MARFETLRSLRDQGLITPEEFTVRRNANVGALLHLTKPPPSANLDRPVPDATQITRRLQAIRRALELRAITVRQHGAERTTIIDGLLPGAPRSRAKPTPRPRDLLAAADAVRRLEQLRERKLISPAEYTAERRAIERVLQPRAPAARKSTTRKSSARRASSPGVHVASYRSERSANRGWAQLRRAHRRFLGNLKHQVTRVNLGRGKGVFYRLIAGPLKSQAEATRLCTQLKRVRQYCEPAIMTGG